MIKCYKKENKTFVFPLIMTVRMGGTLMSLKPGGRADNGGNHYEGLHFTKLLLDLSQEQISSIKVEPLGIAGEGIEYVVTANNGEHRYYQCKGSNGAAVKWRPCDLEGHRVFKTANEHILRGENNVEQQGIPSPTGRPKWNREAIDKLLSNGCAIIGVNQQALVAQAVTLI